MYIFFFVKQQLLFMPFCLLYKNKIFQKNEKVYMFFCCEIFIKYFLFTVILFATSCKLPFCYVLLF